MNERAAALIEGIEARPFAGGFEELSALAASSFTGIVRLDPDGAGSSETVAAGATTPTANPAEAETGARGDADAAPEPSTHTESECPDGLRTPWLAMVDGEVRGVFDGDIDAFEAGPEAEEPSNGPRSARRGSGVAPCDGRTGW